MNLQRRQSMAAEVQINGGTDVRVRPPRQEKREGDGGWPGDSTIITDKNEASDNSLKGESTPRMAPEFAS